MEFSRKEIIHRSRRPLTRITLLHGHGVLCLLQQSKGQYEEEQEKGSPLLALVWLSTDA